MVNASLAGVLFGEGVWFCCCPRRSLEGLSFSSIELIIVFGYGGEGGGCRCELGAGVLVMSVVALMAKLGDGLSEDLGHFMCGHKDGGDDDWICVFYTIRFFGDFVTVMIYHIGFLLDGEPAYCMGSNIQFSRMIVILFSLSMNGISKAFIRSRSIQMFMFHYFMEAIKDRGREAVDCDKTVNHLERSRSEFSLQSVIRRSALLHCTL